MTKSFVRLPLLFTIIFIATILAISLPNGRRASGVVCATSCSTPNVKSDGKGPLRWQAGLTAKIYIDPSFSQQEQDAIKAGANAWKDAGAFPNVMFTTQDPGYKAGGGNIRFVQSVATVLGTLGEGAPVYGLTNGLRTTDVMGGEITFDSSVLFPDGTHKYVPGTINGGYAFLTVVAEHELAHVLGLDDFKDASGNEIDSSDVSVMGESNGTNNNGVAPTATTPGTPPGHISGITDCDRNVVVPQSNAGSPPQPLPSPDPGYGGGGGGGGGYSKTCDTYYYYEWNDDTSTLTLIGADEDCSYVIY